MGTKQTVEKTISEVRKLNPEYTGSVLFANILAASVEEGMDHPSPSQLKENLKKAGLTVVVGNRSGVNVPVQVTKPGEITDDVPEPEPVVVAQGRAPTENEALLLAVCAEARSELSGEK